MLLYRLYVFVCGGIGCILGGLDRIYDVFLKEIEVQNLKDEIQVICIGCFGFCVEGLIVIVYLEGVFYSKVVDFDVKEIVEEYFLKGRIVKRFLYREFVEEGQIKLLNEVKFYKKQM